ncbi:MAG: metallophosphoesterase family protein [Nitrososphaerota archaeon]|nr:metallophosphoesterase family protein [Nitrososphaerota archaeon]
MTRASITIGFIVDIHDNPETMTWLEESVHRYDVVAIGGDIGEISLLYRIVDFAVDKPVFIVLGNHDYPVREMFAAKNVLHGTSTRFGGYTIGGLGGSLPVQGGPLELEETEYLVLTKNLGPVDVLISHQPPINTKIDLSYDGSTEMGVRNIGSTAIRKYIVETQPILALVGHVHESPGVDVIGRTTIVNPGPFMTGNYAEVILTDQDKPVVELRNKEARTSQEWPKS